MVQNMKILIDFKNTASSAEITDYISSNNLVLLKVFDSFEKLYMVESDAIPPSSDIVENVIADSSITINPLLSTISVKKTEDNDWWKYVSLDDTNDGAEEILVTQSGQETIVYVLDSGVEVTHSEFAGKTITNLFSFNGDFVDYNGHGTAIASLLCGNTCAVANAVVKSVKIFQSSVDTTILDLVLALEEIGKDISATPDKFHVINMSWGINKNEWIESKIRELILQNAVVVAAAGNSGVSIETITPASMPDVFTVGAYNSNLASCNFTNYSGAITNTANQVNTGAIDVWSPGQDVMVALPGGTYGLAGGTSIAAAVHSSALAYNSKNLISTNNTRPSDHQILNYISVGRRNFLALDDQYSFSKNVMSIFYTTYAGVSQPVNNGVVVELTVESGKPFEKVIAPSNVFKSIEAVNTLPTSLTVADFILKGTVDVAETTTFVYNMTGIDFGNNVVNFDVQLTVVKDNLVNTNLNYVVNVNLFVFDNSNVNERKF